jgi:hypothetical protein
MINRLRKSRSFERLESRYALAGNVTAVVDGSGNLLINGDALGNGIHFTEVSTGKFDLTGFFAGGADTTINGGAPNNTVHLTGVTGSVTIRGNNGDDQIRIPYFNFGGWFIVNTGDGDDYVELGDHIGNISTAKQSFLVGVLSIRTGKGSDTVSEKFINVIGNQDYGAPGIKLPDPNTDHQRFWINNSTFGSFLYFDFGGRGQELKMNTVNTTGDLFVYNKVLEPGESGAPDFVPTAVESDFLARIDNLTTDGDLTLDSTLMTEVSINFSIILGDTYGRSIGSINSYDFNESSFGNLETEVNDSYIEHVFVPAIYRHRLESEFDAVGMHNVYVSGSAYLQSNGTIFVDGVTAAIGTFWCMNNAISITNPASANLYVQNSNFDDLMIAIGSTQTPAYSGENNALSDPDQLITARVYNTTVSGFLWFGTGGRISTGFTSAPEQASIPYVSVNKAAAIYDLDSCVIGTLRMSPVVESENSFTHPSGAVPGPNTYNIFATRIANVELTLLKSDDTINFNGSIVDVKTDVDGGAGTNLFHNNGSILKNLQKKSFAN